MSDGGRIIFNRPPRIQRSLPEGALDIPLPPPRMFNGGKIGWIVLLTPLLMGLLSMTAIVLLTVLRPSGNAILILASAIMSVGFVITGVVNIIDRILTDRTNKNQYNKLLDKREEQLRDYALQQQTILHYLYPSLPQILDWTRERGLRLWERRITDEDFLRVRLGIGSRPNAIEVEVVKDDKDNPDATRAIALSQKYQEITNVPDIVELNEVALMGMVGERQRVVPFLRAIICHLAAHHSPDNIKILATYSPQHAADWNWVGWLPHARVATHKGDDVPMVASYPDQLEMLGNFVLDTIKQRDNQRQASNTNLQGINTTNANTRKKPYCFPNLVWIVDDFELVQDVPAIRKVLEIGAELGVYLITTSETPDGIPDRCRAITEIMPNGLVRYGIVGEGGRITTLQPDLANLEFCEDFALAMAPLEVKASSSKGDLPGSLRLLDMLNLETNSGEIFDPLTLWNRSSVTQLRVPIGRVFGGQELYLDISDKGHGPHGLVAGTTGSGKSELLLTLVCSLALANHPDNLNFILGDFKGGATFNPFIKLPHVVGMMSDLDLTIVERAMTAIFSELKRREHLLKEAGVTHIRDYQKIKPTPKVPMPYLLVIIDEFAEMKEQAPDFMDKIVNIARTGRTLGVHLILATQRPAGVVSGQLNSNTKYRLCLRVEAVEDSNDMLGRRDAALIPSNMPGRAFFKVGSDIYEQFQVARVAIPFAANAEAEAETEEPLVMRIDKHWRLGPLLPEKLINRAKAKQADKEGVELMDYDVVTQQCIAAAKRTVIRNTHKPWLEPMEADYYLPNYLKDGFDTKNLQWPNIQPYGYGVAPVALIDNVVQQKQEPLELDLLKDGSYCISGLAVSGKTTLIRTMLTALAQTHTPDDLCFYLLDMGNTLKSFADLPHQTTYVPMSKQAALADIFEQLYLQLQHRKTLFANKGVLDMMGYRQIATEAEKLPLILVAFDNYASIRHNPPFEMEHLKALVREGRPYGMHVAITMERASDFEYGRMAEQFFQFALRQSRDDLPFQVPKNMIGSWNGVPGRGFIRGGRNKPPLEVQIFLPCSGDADNQVKNLEDLVGKMKLAASKNLKWANLNTQTELALPELKIQDMPIAKVAEAVKGEDNEAKQIEIKVQQETRAKQKAALEAALMADLLAMQAAAAQENSAATEESGEIPTGLDNEQTNFAAAGDGGSQPVETILTQTEPPQKKRRIRI